MKKIAMKPLLLLSLSLTAALGIPLKQSPVLTEGNLSPLLGDSVPAQGHVEVENPALKDPQTERRFCAGVAPDSKCYQFFKGPKTFKDAEYFCRQHFSEGHLASITSQFIHQEVLKLILEQNGSYARVWVGGYRLDRNHFIWMDGSMWSYADWLAGEPNNTSGVEDCLEVLGYFESEPGKLNDFTCWTPQAFVCSYPHH